MAELKTQRNRKSVRKFLAGVKNEDRRKDALVIAAMMEEITGAKPEMWGTSIVGFGTYHYRSASGREGDWFLTGFSPRVASSTLYIMSGFSAYENLLARLGKHSTGKSCLYIKRLSEVDLAVLRKLIEASVNYIKKKEQETVSKQG